MLLYSQAATTRALMPLGIALGIPPQFLIAMYPSVNGYFFIPTYGSLIAAINFDLSGTTKIGKYVLNHLVHDPGRGGHGRGGGHRAVPRADHVLMRSRGYLNRVAGPMKLQRAPELRAHRQAEPLSRRQRPHEPAVVDPGDLPALGEAAQRAIDRGGERRVSRGYMMP